MKGEIDTIRPPKWGEWLLHRLTPLPWKEAILGDLQEEYGVRCLVRGRRRAWLWYWRELLRTAPVLVREHIAIIWFRRQLMKIFNWRENRLAWLSLLCLLPAVLLVGSGLLQSGFGFTSPNDTLDQWRLWPIVNHPIVLLGGLAFGLIFNLWTVLKVQWQRQDNNLVSTVTIRGSVIHLFIIGLASCLLATILIYALFENFLITPR